MSLTAIQVKKAAPKEKKYRLYDSQGLYLEVRPNGNKYFYLKYYLDKKEKHLLLGSISDITLLQAREETQKARQLIKQGINPLSVKQSEKLQNLQNMGNTFGSVLTDYLKVYKKRVNENTYKKAITRLNYALPSLGSRIIGELSINDYLNVLKPLSEKKPTQALRLKAELQMIINHAIMTGRAKENPLIYLKRALPVKKSEHYRAVTTPKELFKVMDKIEGLQINPILKTAINLLPYLFVRPNELCAMKWADLDLDQGLWTYTATKTDEKMIVPLADTVKDLLKNLIPFTGGKDFVFANKGKSGHIEKGQILRAFCLSGIASIQSAHGFRATARTILDEILGFRVAIIEKQLGHRVKDINGNAYNRTSFLNDRVQMMKAWASFLDNREAKGNVLQFPKSA